MRLMVFLFGIIASGFSSAYDFHLQNVKVLSVTPFLTSDYFVRIALDLSNYASDPFVTGCAPTRDAWVVSAWGYTQEFESQMLATASFALASEATVDVWLHDSVCDTNAGLTNLPTVGSPSENMSVIPAGLGRRAYGLRLHAQ